MKRPGKGRSVHLSLNARCLTIEISRGSKKVFYCSLPLKKLDRYWKWLLFLFPFNLLFLLNG